MNRLLFDIKFKYRLTRHIMFFLVLVFTFALILYARKDEAAFARILLVTFFNSLFFIGYAYITIFLLIPEFLLKRKIGWFLLLFILIGLGLSSIKMIFSDEIFYSAISPENYSAVRVKSIRFIMTNTKDMTFVVALFCVAKFAKDFIYTESLRRKLEKQNKEAQRKLLQSQLNPHFLFNTINNLYALSLLKPEQTNEVIERLQIVLGYIVDQSQRDFVSLEDEMFLIENYILLEKIRYGNRLKIDLKNEGDLRPWNVPPMVLFFLVENSFKHGSSADADKPWIAIDLKASSRQITFLIANSKPDKQVHENKNGLNGKGLKYLRKRLDIIYTRDGYKMEINDGVELFSVKLELTNNWNEIGRKTYR